LPGNPENKGTKGILSDVGQHCAQMEKIMTKVKEIYQCEACGNVVEVKEAGDGELVCCDMPMKKQ
jgi:superoxide reductase